MKTKPTSRLAGRLNNLQNGLIFPLAQQFCKWHSMHLFRCGFVRSVYNVATESHFSKTLVVMV